MNGKRLLDTNIIISLFANDKGILENLTKASEVFIPSIVKALRGILNDLENPILLH